MNHNMESEKLRDSRRTKRKLYDAVGDILRTEGYTGLGTNNIARYADVHKKLIYRYFVGPQQLIESYVLETDYWTRAHRTIPEIFAANAHNFGRDLVGKLLEEKFEYLSANVDFQNIILWEINAKSQVMNKISKFRESIRSELFELIDPHFKDSSVNIRAIEAILISGIYYLVLHSKNSGSNFCGLDLKNEADRKEIVKVLKQMIGWAFDAAEKKK